MLSGNPKNNFFFCCSQERKTGPQNSRSLKQAHETTSGKKCKTGHGHIKKFGYKQMNWFINKMFFLPIQHQAGASNDNQHLFQCLLLRSKYVSMDGPHLQTCQSLEDFSCTMSQHRFFSLLFWQPSSSAHTQELREIIHTNSQKGLESAGKNMFL